MAMTLLGGWVEGEQKQEELKNARALADLRRMEVQQAGMRLQQEAATTTALERFYGGMSSTEQQAFNNSPASVQAMTVGKYLMPINPKLGMDFLRRAKEDKIREVEEHRLQVKEAAAEREQLGGILASINSAETYQEGMQQYVDEGGQLPSWYTGNYERDKPMLERQARAFMRQKDQMSAEDRRLGLDLKLQDLVRRQARDAELADEAADRARRAEKRAAALEAWREEQLAQRDKDRAARQQGKPAKAGAKIPSKLETTMALDIISDREELKGAEASTKLKVATVLASRAKAKMATEEDAEADIASVMETELERMINKGELRPGKASTVFGFDVPFTGGKPSFTPSRTTSSQDESPAKSAVGDKTVEAARAAALKAWGEFDLTKFDYWISPKGRIYRSRKQ